MELLLGANVLRIPIPGAVLTRWEAEAEASGFPLDQWVAQRVEAYLEAVSAQRAGAPSRAQDAPTEASRARGPQSEFTPCPQCTTPKSCWLGRQNPRECR